MPAPHKIGELVIRTMYPTQPPALPAAATYPCASVCIHGSPVPPSSVISSIARTNCTCSPLPRSLSRWPFFVNAAFEMRSSISRCGCSSTGSAERPALPPRESPVRDRRHHSPDALPVRGIPRADGRCSGRQMRPGRGDRPAAASAGIARAGRQPSAKRHRPRTWHRRSQAMLPSLTECRPFLIPAGIIHLWFACSGSGVPPCPAGVKQPFTVLPIGCVRRSEINKISRLYGNIRQ